MQLLAKPLYDSSTALHHTIIRYIFIPNILNEWLALLLRIEEVQGLLLGPEIGYAERGLSYLSQKENAEIV
jgi:hypothetical protein